MFTLYSDPNYATTYQSITEPPHLPKIKLLFGYSLNQNYPGHRSVFKGTLTQRFLRLRHKAFKNTIPRWLLVQHEHIEKIVLSSTIYFLSEAWHGKTIAYSLKTRQCVSDQPVCIQQLFGFQRVSDTIWYCGLASGSASIQVHSR